MKDILKTIILKPSPEKLALLRPHLSFFKGNDQGFDDVVEFVDRFNIETSGDFPTLRAFQYQATLESNENLWKYVQEIVNDQAVGVIEDNSDFFMTLKSAKQMIFDYKLMEYQNALTASRQIQGTQEEKLEAISEVNTNIHKLIASMNAQEVEDSSLLYGEDAVKEFEQDYQKIQDEKEKGNLLYLDIGLSDLEEVKIKPGDLFTVAGYSSQGKSIWLRYITYHLAVNHGLNGAFFTFEMSSEIIRRMFYIIHANNAMVFPSAKPIPYDAYKYGNLTEEQYDQLKAAIEDLTHNPNYGSIKIIQPKGNFTVQDLSARIREIELKEMLLRVVAIDYLTKMRPMIPDWAQPTTADINLMFSDTKALGLNHRDPQGREHPLIMLTAAQIPRFRYEECVKNQGRYNIMCCSDYNEIERSSDILMSSLMTPDMRAAGLIRGQYQKNRDGVVPPDPSDFFIDLPHGAMIYEKEQQTEDITDQLRDLDI